MNAPLSVTASGVYCGLKMAVDPEQPDPAQLRLLAHDRGEGAEGLGGQRRSSPRPSSTPTTRSRTASPTW